jgi:membrane protein DedA with SNARE-associated domain
MGVPYRIFAPSVAISTGIWAAVGLWIGATFGQSIGNLLARNPWIYLVALGLVIVAIAVALVRLWRDNDNRPRSVHVDDAVVKPRAAD